MKKLKISNSVFFFLFVAFSSCNNIPDSFTDSDKYPEILPQYNSVVIPFNIAPLNFSINENAEDYRTKIYSKKGNSIICKGKEVRISLNKWKDLLAENKGASVYFDIYLMKDKKWFKQKTIENKISEDAIDNYTVYRYIQPLYTTYEDMSINQRNLENFEVKTLIDNMVYSSEKNSHCVNCHSFQDYNKGGNMQIHFRGKNGGTVLIVDNEHKKVNPKADGLKSGAVYPAWHPDLKYIAYSINDIGQNFHTKSTDKVEVLDSRSDLILYDIENNEVIKITETEDYMETFPYWSPDGEYLYYCSAHFVMKTKEPQSETINNYKNIKYDLLRVPFNKADKTFGKADTIFKASSMGKSATFPRISPDGKYMMFTLGEFGNFHIWHKTSDLYLMDLKTRKYHNLDNINSKDVESYHSWSSNGRWFIFSSRRDDGGYTRLYISYFDKNGNAHKPFILPQEDPLFYKKSFKSFNIPEFIVEPVRTNRHKLYKASSGEAEKAKLVN